MDDHKIVSLYFERNETAIAESEKKYGRYLHSVAYGILFNHEDARECTNDTYLSAWNAIPPQKPTVLRAFLAKITRNLAINRYHHENAEKRRGEVYDIVEEFWQCVPDPTAAVEDQVALKIAIDSFLASLPQKTRSVFLQRYWYMGSIKDIAQRNHLSESNIKVLLMRTRDQFREHLESQGVF